MRLNFTLFILLLLPFVSDAQKLTGIWRGYFSSSGGSFREGIREENYKYEIQIDQLSTNGVKGVTYSYKTTVFYGKAEISGIYNPTTKSLILKENKLVDLKIGDKSDPCLMTCYLDYSKIGKLEVLEGTFISINVKDKGDCGSGKVYLERVTTTDFKKEDFLTKKKPEDTAKTKTAVTAKPLFTVPPVSSGSKDNTVTKTVPQKQGSTQTTPQQKPAQVSPKSTLPAVTAKKTVEKPQYKPQSGKKEENPLPKPVTERVPEELVNNTTPKKTEGETQQTENSSRKIEVPKVILERENRLVKTITTSQEDIEVNLYDNGTIDNDTITVYHNNQLVVSSARLSLKPINFKIKCSKTDNRHEITIVAENLGDIPPNTAMMVITAGGFKERYEIFLSSTEQQNAKVIIKYVPKE